MPKPTKEEQYFQKLQSPKLAFLNHLQNDRLCKSLNALRDAKNIYDSKIIHIKVRDDITLTQKHADELAKLDKEIAELIERRSAQFTAKLIPVATNKVAPTQSIPEVTTNTVVPVQEATNTAVTEQFVPEVTKVEQSVLEVTTNTVVPVQEATNTVVTEQFVPEVTKVEQSVLEVTTNTVVPVQEATNMVVTEQFVPEVTKVEQSVLEVTTNTVVPVQEVTNTVGREQPAPASIKNNGKLQPVTTHPLQVIDDFVSPPTVLSAKPTFENIKRLAKLKNIDEQLIILEMKKAELSKDHYLSKDQYKEAANALGNIIDEMRVLNGKFIVGVVTEENYTKEAKTILAPEKLAKLEEFRGFKMKKVGEVLVNLLVAISTAFIGYGIAAAIKGDLLLFRVNTDSKNKVLALEDTFEKEFAAPIA